MVAERFSAESSTFAPVSRKRRAPRLSNRLLVLGEGAKQRDRGDAPENDRRNNPGVPRVKVDAQDRQPEAELIVPRSPTIVAAFPTIAIRFRLSVSRGVWPNAARR